MTEQATTPEATPARGPVKPPEPDLSALGGGSRKRRDRAARLAAAQSGAPSGIPPALAGGTPPLNSGDPASGTTDTDQQVPAQQAATPLPATERPTAEPKPNSEPAEQAAAPPKQASTPVKAPPAPTAEPSGSKQAPTEKQQPAAEVAQDAATKEPVTEQGPEQHERPEESSTAAPAAITQPAGTIAAKDTSVTGEQVSAAGGSSTSGPAEEIEPVAELGDDGQESGGASGSIVIPDVAGAAGTSDTKEAGEAKAPDVEGSSTTDTTEQVKAVTTELDDEVDEDLYDEDLDDDEDFTAGKLTQQSWVPDAVADKFQRMQATGHGRTAEVIVLTAVRNCAEKFPELIKAARGPVHEDGLFAGLPILDRKPGRQPKSKPNSSRVQYQVSAEYVPALKRLAKTHKLKLSVLIRLALGDYFGIPVRLGRTKR